MFSLALKYTRLSEYLYLSLGMSFLAASNACFASGVEVVQSYTVNDINSNLWASLLEIKSCASDDKLHEKLSYLGRTSPINKKCFISHKWNESDDLLVQRIVDHLVMTGVSVYFDKHDGEFGAQQIGDVSQFIAQGIEKSDVYILACTTAFYDEYFNPRQNWIKIEVNAITERLANTQKKTIPLLLRGTSENSIPTLFRGNSSRVDFTKQDKTYYHHFGNLLERIIGTRLPHLDSVASEIDDTTLQQSTHRLRKWEQAVQSSTIVYLPYFDSYSFCEAIGNGEAQSYLTKLWKALHKTHSTVITGKFDPSLKYTIAGMGGVGKTQLALAYANEALKNNAYDVIYWIYSETPESITQSYKKLLEDFGVDVSAIKPHLTQSRVEDMLRKRSQKWLLIYDNVTSSRQMKAIAPQRGGHILVTSRDKIGWDYRQINLDVFQPNEAVSYLLQKSGLVESITPDQQNMALAIAEELGYLPLALSLAASYMEENHMDFKTYLAQLKTQATEFFLYHPDEELCLKTQALISCKDESERKERFKDIRLYAQETYDYPFAIGLTWSLSHQKLESIDEQVFSYLCYCDPDNIPVDTLKFLEVKSGETRTSVDSRQLMNSIYKLERYSLISYNKEKNMVSLHRLVQRAQLHNAQQILETLEKLTYAWLRFLEKQECLIDYQSTEEKTKEALYKRYQKVSSLLIHKNKIDWHLENFNKTNTANSTSSTDVLEFLLKVLEDQTADVLSKIANALHVYTAANNDEAPEEDKALLKKQQQLDQQRYLELIREGERIKKRRPFHLKDTPSMRKLDSSGSNVALNEIIHAAEQGIDYLRAINLKDKTNPEGGYILQKEYDPKDYGSEDDDIPEIREIEEIKELRNYFLKLKKEYAEFTIMKHGLKTLSQLKGAKEKLKPFLTQEMSTRDQSWLVHSLLKIEEEEKLMQALEKVQLLKQALNEDYMDSFDISLVISESLKYKLYLWVDSIKKVEYVCEIINSERTTKVSIELVDYLCLIKFASMIDNEKWIYNIKYTALLLTGRSSDAIYWFFELTGKIDMTEMQLYDAKIDSAEKLIDWYRKSANDNNVLLARILFDMYSESGRRDDMLEACKWCVKAANLGNAECQRALDGDLNDGSFYFYRDSYHYVKLVAEHKARRGKELGFGGFVANQESYNDCYDWSIGIPK